MTFQITVEITNRDADQNCVSFTPRAINLEIDFCYVRYSLHIINANYNLPKIKWSASSNFFHEIKVNQNFLVVISSLYVKSLS